MKTVAEWVQLLREEVGYKPPEQWAEAFTRIVEDVQDEEREACAELAEAHEENYKQAGTIAPTAQRLSAAMGADVCRILAREIRARGTTAR
ncbi:MAG TPA: hypothetical protein VI172_02355 [Candidatus Dormibacteraeota bacterium]